ncbi:MAG: NAD-dependent epimerase/dehydratase family protein [Legionella sp.]|nr:NAD-dependent epimerase/dehydratase family protein [Legionella sp.]
MGLLILGGSGFLGKALLRRLIACEISFDVLTRTPGKLGELCSSENCIQADLSAWETLNLSNYQCIINCAGELNDTKNMRALHVDSTLGLLKKWATYPSLQKKRHWIEISSVGIYGKPRQGQVTEGTVSAPIGEYESTKSEADLGVQKIAKRLGLIYTIIRPSTLFGVGMPNQSLRQLIHSIRHGRFAYIGHCGHQASMNYVPVEDVADFIVACLGNRAAYNQDFIISDQMPLKSFVETVTEHMTTTCNHFYTLPERPLRCLVSFLSLFLRLPLTNARIDALTTSVVYSTKKSKEILQFTPLLGIRKGLINYCQSLQAAYRDNE